MMNICFEDVETSFVAPLTRFEALVGVYRAIAIAEIAGVSNLNLSSLPVCYLAFPHQASRQKFNRSIERQGCPPLASTAQAVWDTL